MSIIYFVAAKVDVTVCWTNKRETNFAIQSLEPYKPGWILNDFHNKVYRDTGYRIQRYSANLW